ncbi:hypothetical protein HGA88_00440 [Candidatus Roizmanbacteria bacterium]|nr:hypothetical protein [Candidatus Roizmanbacteria bacterium]
MTNIQLIRGEIDTTESLNTIVQAYQEISVMRMQKIRTKVIQTREFMEQLSSIFVDVKKSYLETLQELVANNKKNTESLYAHGTSAVVLLTANAKLYGGIMSAIFRQFLEYVRNHPESDIVLIGKLGQQLYFESGEQKKTAYFELPDKELELKDIEPVMLHLATYDTINVFHGKFETLLTQTVNRANITGDQTLEMIAPLSESEGEESSKDLRDERDFLFEPQLNDVFYFFKNQIVISLLNQTLRESQLAQHASRIRTMEDSSQNIVKALKKMYFMQRQAKKNNENKKQLEQFVFTMHPTL